MKKQIFNPYLPLDTYIPDGEPHVFEDRLYIFGSHDEEGGNKFCVLPYECWSAPLSDLTDFRCEGTIYEAEQDAFDGAAPFVIGSPYAIPNCQTTRAHAERILRDKLPLIMDAVDAGGSGNPYEGLNEEEAEALREVTLFGYPMRSWFASEGMNDGSLAVLAPTVKQIDPGYFEEFWNTPGYLGAKKEGSAVKDKICMDTKVKLEYIPGKKAQLLDGTADENIDTRNGVNDAWKKMISSAGQDTEPWLELEKVPQAPDGKSLYLQGLVMTVKTGKAAGKKAQIKKIEDNRVYLKDGFGMDNIGEILKLIEVGDELHLDNSDYIAIQTYHRHPNDQFRGGT